MERTAASRQGRAQRLASRLLLGVVPLTIAGRHEVIILRNVHKLMLGTHIPKRDSRLPPLGKEHGSGTASLSYSITR
jgi:hypothetical protein